MNTKFFLHQDYCFYYEFINLNSPVLIYNWTTPQVSPCSENMLYFQNFNVKPADNRKHNKSLVKFQNNSC